MRGAAWAVGDSLMKNSAPLGKSASNPFLPCSSNFFRVLSSLALPSGFLGFLTPLDEPIPTVGTSRGTSLQRLTGVAPDIVHFPLNSSAPIAYT